METALKALCPGKMTVTAEPHFSLQFMMQFPEDGGISVTSVNFSQKAVSMRNWAPGGRWGAGLESFHVG